MGRPRDRAEAELAFAQPTRLATASAIASRPAVAAIPTRGWGTGAFTRRCLSPDLECLLDGRSDLPGPTARGGSQAVLAGLQLGAVQAAEEAEAVGPADVDVRK